METVIHELNDGTKIVKIVELTTGDEFKYYEVHAVKTGIPVVVFEFNLFDDAQDFYNMVRYNVQDMRIING